MSRLALAFMLSSFVFVACEEGGPSSTTNAPECLASEKWTGGNAESPMMHPGGTCITCHTSEGEGPKFTVAGTVFEGLHEPVDCYGVQGAKVEITDADGKTLSLTTNAAGNFYSTAAVAFPFTAKVTYDGRERSMVTAQSSGDCNSCHTENGANTAPGRIELP